MYNEELFKKLQTGASNSELIIFAELMAARHEILYAEHINEGIDEFSEEDFERDWWLNKLAELKTGVNTDPIIESVVRKFRNRSAFGIKKYGTTLKDNTTDDFLTHLQEELMDACNYVEKMKDLLNQKGYLSFVEVPNLNDFNEDLNK